MENGVGLPFSDPISGIKGAGDKLTSGMATQACDTGSRSVKPMRMRLKQMQGLAAVWRG